MPFIHNAELDKVLDQIDDIQRHFQMAYRMAKNRRTWKMLETLHNMVRELKGAEE